MIFYEGDLLIIKDSEMFSIRDGTHWSKLLKGSANCVIVVVTVTPLNYDKGYMKYEYTILHRNGILEYLYPNELEKMSFKKVGQVKLDYTYDEIYNMHRDKRQVYYRKKLYPKILESSSKLKQKI